MLDKLFCSCNSTNEPPPPTTSFGEMVGGCLKSVGRLVGSRLLLFDIQKYFLDRVNCLVNIVSRQEKSNKCVSTGCFYQLSNSVPDSCLSLSYPKQSQTNSNYSYDY